MICKDPYRHAGNSSDQHSPNVASGTMGCIANSQSMRVIVDEMPERNIGNRPPWITVGPRYVIDYYQANKIAVKVCSFYSLSIQTSSRSVGSIYGDTRH